MLKPSRNAALRPLTQAPKRQAQRAARFSPDAASTIAMPPAVASDLPDWLMSAILASAGLALCLLILPRAKGLFIAAIWAWRARPS